MFDAIRQLRAVQIVATFYQVQYVHMKRDFLGCSFMFVANFRRYVSAKN